MRSPSPSLHYGGTVLIHSPFAATFPLIMPRTEVVSAAPSLLVRHLSSFDVTILLTVAFCFFVLTLAMTKIRKDKQLYMNV